MRRKLFSPLFSLVTSLFLLAGCASSGTTPSSDTNTSSNAVSCEIDQGRTGSNLTHRHCTPSSSNDTANTAASENTTKSN
jgi:hypothetical protein